jgi:hypothetical protein
MLVRAVQEAYLNSVLHFAARNQEVFEEMSGARKGLTMGQREWDLQVRCNISFLPFLHLSSFRKFFFKASTGFMPQPENLLLIFSLSSPLPKTMASGNSFLSRQQVRLSTSKSPASSCMLPWSWLAPRDVVCRRNSTISIVESAPLSSNRWTLLPLDLSVLFG